MDFLRTEDNFRCTATASGGVDAATRTAQQAIVLRALRNAGLKPSDVRLTPLQLGDFPDAIRTSQVDVAPLGEPQPHEVPRSHQGRRRVRTAAGADLRPGFDQIIAETVDEIGTSTTPKDIS